MHKDGSKAGVSSEAVLSPPHVAIGIEINEDENDKFSWSVTLAPFQEPDRPTCPVATILVTQYTTSIIGQGWFKAVRLQWGGLCLIS